MDLFDEVNKSKKDFPKANAVKTKVGSYKLNLYQMFAIAVFILCFFLGIVFGNLFSTCTTTSYFSNDTCLVTEFNFSIMFGIWFISLVVCVFMFAIGHIIAILSQINDKLANFK
jgi:ABC-type thiamin/hydroxymethylpyrimidine transport system permease subunit